MGFLSASFWNIITVSSVPCLLGLCGTLHLDFSRNNLLPSMPALFLTGGFLFFLLVFGLIMPVFLKNVLPGVLDSCSSRVALNHSHLHYRKWKSHSRFLVRG